ncbi:MAG: sigma-70 family RNA polymerase sigma factor [Candidatus Aminicenantales bacterium]
MAPNISSDETLALGAIPTEGERRIVLAAQRGDEEAFRELYQTYRDPIWTLINSLVGDPLQAQDLLQNVFFKAFRGLGGFRFQSGLFTWIYRIAHNECRNHLRKRSIPLLPLESVLGSQAEIDRTRVSDRSEARKAALRAAVMELPFKMREVIVLKYLEGLSYKEMSRILGCPPGTVASRLNRALTELEGRLRASGGLL